MGSEIIVNLDSEYTGLEETIEQTIAFLDNYRKIDSPLFWNESGRKLAQFNSALRQGRKDKELVAYSRAIEKNCAKLLGDMASIEHTMQDTHNTLSKASKDIPNEKETLQYLRKVEPAEAIDRLYSRAEEIESRIKIILPKLESLQKALPEFLGRIQSLKSYADAMK